MPGNELTLQAKAAIQAYMLKFVIPSATVLTIMSGLFGYVLSGIARIDASAEAAKAALFAAQSAAEAKSSAARASEEAKKASDDANGSLERARTSEARATDTAKSLLTVRDQVDKVLAGQYDGLAKSLMDTPGFRESIGKIPEKELTDFRLRISKIESSIYEGATQAVPAPGGVCPPGTYAVILSQVSVSGGRAGYLESVSLQCRTLRFEKPK